LLKKIYGNDERARTHFANVPDILEPREYLEYAVRQNGDADEGRGLFNDVAGMACITCHRVGDQGVSIGPDLTSVGSQFSRHELAESILHPSKAVREGYQAVEIETQDDESFSGLAKGETGTEVLLLDRLGQLQRIPKDKVASRRNSEFSLMPEGLHAALTLEQFAGLISYLESLKGNPASP
jgi:quinoprotein glucose dehydrogenase